MRSYLLYFSLFLLVIFLSGCLRIPQPTTYAYSEQQKMQAAHHWDVLANDVANQVNNELIRQGYIETPVFVRHSCGIPDSCGPGETFPFDEGFNDLLTTQLVSFGVPTQAAQEEKGLTVDYKVQVLYHRANRNQVLRPGTITALTAGIMVFRNAPQEIINIAAAAAVDLARSYAVMNGHFEVIITTSIVDDNMYVMRKSDIYYIQDADFWHYKQTEPAAEIELTNS